MDIKSFVGGFGIAGIAAAVLFVAQCERGGEHTTAPTACVCGGGASTTTHADLEVHATPSPVAARVAIRAPHAGHSHAGHVAVHVDATVPAAAPAPVPSITLAANDAPIPTTTLAPAAAPVADAPTDAPTPVVAPAPPTTELAQAPAEPDPALALFASAMPSSVSLGVAAAPRAQSTAHASTSSPTRVRPVTAAARHL